MPTLINSFSLSSTVGIGTNTPNKNLTVVGEVSASRNLFVGGDLNVYGTLFTYGSSVLLSSTNLEVGDPMIYIANNNTATNNPFDIGIVGHFSDSTSVPAGVGYQHTGFVRNRLTGNWTLFSGVTTEPSDNNTINWSDPRFKLDTINANLSGGSFITTNLTTANIFGIANETVFSDDTTVIGNGNGTLTMNYSNGIFSNSGKYVLSGGNVGIGTALPNRTLTVVGGVSATGATSVLSLSTRFINLEHSIPNDGINPVLFIGERGDGSGNTAVGSLSGFNTTYDETNNRLIVSTQFGTSTSLSAVTITSAGNVGIGTTVPNYPLTVSGTVSATNFRAVQGIPSNGDSSTNGYSFGADGDTGIFSPIGINGAANNNGQLGIFCNNAEQMRFNGTNVGIGTTEPNRKLTIVGDISATGSITAGSNWNNQTTNYVIQDSDCGGIIAITNTTNLTAEIPNNSFRRGYQTSVLRGGTGAVTVSAAPGVTLNQAYGLRRLSAQWSVATLTYSGNATTGWILFGDLA